MNDKIQLALFGLILAIGLIISTYLVTDVIRDVRLSHQIMQVLAFLKEHCVDQDEIHILSVSIIEHNKLDESGKTGEFQHPFCQIYQYFL